MRKLFVVLGVVAAVPLTFFACSASVTNEGNTAADGGIDAPVVIVDNDARDDSAFLIMPEAAPMTSCTLSGGNDPVEFCLQKAILKAQIEAAYVPDAGVLPSWSSGTRLPDSDGGIAAHDLHDDLAFAASMVSYRADSVTYGDTEVTQRFDADFGALVQVILRELSTLPAEFRGDTYLWLRTIQGGANAIGGPAAPDAAVTLVGSEIDALADAYGRSIYDQYAHVLSTSAGDGGSADAGASSDAAAPLDGGYHGEPVDMVLGYPVLPTTFSYATDEVASGALALLDMADRHAVDDPAGAAQWQVAALASLDHIVTRARDATTGMMYWALITGPGAGHDALGAPSQYPSDALLSEVNASVIMSLMRAAALAAQSTTLSTDAKTYPYVAHARDLYAAVNGGFAIPATVSLWDGPEGPSAAAGAGYFEGYIPSTQTTIQTKSTRANALMFEALRHLTIDDGSLYQWQLALLRALMTSTTTSNASFLSAIDSQAAFFRATTGTFTPIATEPMGSSYRSSSTSAALESMQEYLYGKKP